MGYILSLRMGIVSTSHNLIFQEHHSQSFSSELFVNIVCGSIPMLKPLYDKWSTGRPLSADNSYQQSRDNSKRHITSSNKSKSSSAGWSFRSAISTNASFGRSADRKSSNEAITIVQSFDVQSKNDLVATEEMR
jgi:hypothetical protein